MSFFRHIPAICRLGIPIVIGQVAIILVSFADNIMVSRHNIDELAAASFVNNFLNLAIIFGIGFSCGLTPLIAESNAKNKGKDSVAWLSNSLFANACIGGIISLIFLILQFFLSSFNVSDELLPIVLPYYRLQILSFFIAMLFNGFKQFYEGMGNTSLPMYITIVGNLLNIFLNYILIYGRWGFPEYGLYGAGVATLISRIFMLLFSYFFMRIHPRWTSVGKSLHRVRIGKKRLARLAQIGGPVAVQMGLEAGSFSIAVVFVARLGTQALAAHQIISVLTTLGFLIYYGFGSATSILVSSFQAKGKMGELRKIASSAYGLCVLIATGMILFLLNYSSLITSLFGTNETIDQYVSWALIPVFLYQFGDALQIIYANALRGIAFVKRLVPFAFLAHIIVAPLLCYIFGFIIAQSRGTGIQLSAIWMAFPFSLTLLGLLLFSDFSKATQYLQTKDSQV